MRFVGPDRTVWPDSSLMWDYAGVGFIQVIAAKIFHPVQPKHSCLKLI